MREAGNPTTDEPSAASLPNFRLSTVVRVALTQAGIGLASWSQKDSTCLPLRGQRRIHLKSQDLTLVDPPDFPFKLIGSCESSQVDRICAPTST